MYALATIRARLGAVTGTFVALALGVALIGTTALVMVSNVARTPDRFSATPAVVYRDGPPFSLAAADSLSSRLTTVEGVAQAIVDYSFYAQPRSSDVSEGHGWSSAAWQGRLQGDPPAGNGDVVVGRRIDAAPGSVVTIFTSAGPAEYRVTGVVDGEGLYFAEEMAHELTSGVAAIGLVVAPGTDLAQLQQRLAGVVGDEGRVLIGAERSALESSLDAGRRDGGSILLGTMASISGFVSVFVVSSTFALSVAQRRREFGLLRSIGATPRQIRRMLLGEALAVGVCAAGCGALLAVPLAPVLGRLLERATLVATGFTPEIVAWPLAGAAGVGILVALLGAWSASRRAGKVAALEALRTSYVETRAMTPARWLFGALFLLAGLGLSVGSVPSGASAVLNAAAFVGMALITGIALLAPVIIPPAAHVMAWPFTRLRGATGILVRENTLVAVRRTASTAAPILVTVGFAALVSGVIATFGVATRQDGLLDARGEVVVLPASTVGLSDAAVAAVPGGESLLMSNVYVSHPDGYQQQIEVAGVSDDVLMRNGLTLGTGRDRHRPALRRLARLEGRRHRAGHFRRRCTGIHARRRNHRRHR